MMIGQGRLPKVPETFDAKGLPSPRAPSARHMIRYAYFIEVNETSLYHRFAR